MKARNLAREDWDFKSLLGDSSQKEIKVCYYYEFAREVPAIRERIEKFRSLARSSLTDLLGDNWSLDTSIGEHPILIALEYPEFFLNYPEWPRTPYFIIDRTIRERRIRALIWDETSDEDLAKRLETSPGIDNPNIWREIKLAVPIYHTHEELIEGFRAYLKLHFPLQGKAGKKGDRTIKIGYAQGGAAEVRMQDNALRALGVYRLRKQMTASKVVTLFEETFLGKGPYHEESAVNRAKALAQKHIARFEKSGDL